MNRFKTAALEIWGLFVDDGLFAVAILGWIAIVWLLLPRLGIAETFGAPLLAIGLAVALVASALAAARR